MHALADVHEMPLRKADMAPIGLTDGWSAHADPFQDSARVILPNGPLFGPIVVDQLPTASHAVDDAQATPNNCASSAPAGFGLGGMVQVVPSHASASVAGELDELNDVPAAMQ